MMKPPTHSIPKALHLVLFVFGIGILGLVSAWANPFNGFTQTKLKESVIEWEKPASTPSWLTEQPKSNAVQAKIQRALDEKLEIDFDSLSFSRIFKIIRGKLDIPIKIDFKAFKEQKVSLDEIVKLPRRRITVRSLMLQILRPHELTYVIDSDTLRITSFAEANIIRHYDLSQIFPDNSLLGELIDTIEMAVYPDDWRINGGTSSISMLGSILSIDAPDETQMEIVSFLRSVSKQAQPNMKPRSFE